MTALLAYSVMCVYVSAYGMNVEYPKEISVNTNKRHRYLSLVVAFKT